MLIKSISIRDDQQDWIKRNDKNLSKFVQRKIDEEMENEVKSDGR